LTNAKGKGGHDIGGGSELASNDHQVRLLPACKKVSVLFGEKVHGRLTKSTGEFMSGPGTGTKKKKRELSRENKLKDILSGSSGELLQTHGGQKGTLGGGPGVGEYAETWANLIEGTSAKRDKEFLS